MSVVIVSLTVLRFKLFDGFQIPILTKSASRQSFNYAFVVLRFVVYSQYDESGQIKRQLAFKTTQFNIMRCLILHWTYTEANCSVTKTQHHQVPESSRKLTTYCSGLLPVTCSNKRVQATHRLNKYNSTGRGRNKKVEALSYSTGNKQPHLNYPPLQLQHDPRIRAVWTSRWKARSANSLWKIHVSL